MSYLKEIEVNNISNLIEKLKGLTFVDIDYVEELDEYLIEVPERNKFLRGIVKYLGWLFGFKDATRFIIQILKDKKENKHYLFFDEIDSLDSIEEIKLLINAIEEGNK